MKIKEIYIKNLQSIGNTPIVVKLSDGITRVSGNNAVGKSLLVHKALSLFTQENSPSRLRSLIPRTKQSRDDITLVGLRLYNKTSLWAKLNKNTNRLEYFYLDKDSKLIKSFPIYSQELREILDLRYVESEDLLLNKKHGKSNLFIDTKTSTNAEILEEICRDKDTEIRLENIKQIREEIKNYRKVLEKYKEVLHRKVKSCLGIGVEELKVLDEELKNLLIYSSYKIRDFSVVSECRLTLTPKVIEKDLDRILLLSLLKDIVKYKQLSKELAVVQGDILLKEKRVLRVEEVQNLHTNFTNTIKIKKFYELIPDVKKYHRDFSFFEDTLRNYRDYSILKDVQTKKKISNLIKDIRFIDNLKLVRDNVKFKKIEDSVSTLNTDLQILKLLPIKQKSPICKSQINMVDKFVKLLEITEIRNEIFKLEKLKKETEEKTKGLPCPMCGTRL